jgi:hypothetical protein
LMPQSQWWRQKCEGPFSGVDPWPGLWGNPPPQLRDWMLFVGMSQYQVKSWLDVVEKTGIQQQTYMWLSRRQIQLTSGSGRPQGALHQNRIVQSATGAATSKGFRSKKRKLSATPLGTTPALLTRLGYKSWWISEGLPFQELCHEPQRWKYLFHWLRPRPDGVCVNCNSVNGYLRDGNVRCVTCYLKQLHQSTVTCNALHCSICGTGYSRRWWAYGMWMTVCDICLESCPDDIAIQDTQQCPVPGCKKGPHLRNKSLDHSGFCRQHMQKQPNQMQFTMLRLKLLLQQLLCHMGSPDVSYKREVWQLLWPLTKLEAEGGLTNPLQPQAPWCLQKIRIQLAQSCAQHFGGVIEWKTCPLGGGEGNSGRPTGRDIGGPSRKRARRQCPSVDGSSA